MSVMYFVIFKDNHVTVTSPPVAVRDSIFVYFRYSSLFFFFSLLCDSKIHSLLIKTVKDKIISVILDAPLVLFLRCYQLRKSGN